MRQTGRYTRQHTKPNESFVRSCKPSEKRRPWMLLGLCLIFVLPFFLGSLLFIFRDDFSFHTTTQGELLSPDLAHKVLGGSADTFLGKWNLVYFSPSDCDATCQEKKKILTNIHLALGKDGPRVRLQSLPYESLMNDTNKMNAIKGSIQGTSEGSILIIDPRGWLVLHYPPSKFYAKAVLDDLRRLLRFSYVG